MRAIASTRNTGRGEAVARGGHRRRNGMLGKLGLAWRRGPNLQHRGGDRKPRRRLQLELDRLVVRGMAEPRPRAVQDLRIHLRPTRDVCSVRQLHRTLTALQDLLPPHAAAQQHVLWPATIHHTAVKSATRIGPCRYRGAAATTEECTNSPPARWGTVFYGYRGSLVPGSTLGLRCRSKRGTLAAAPFARTWILRAPAASIWPSERL